MAFLRAVQSSLIGRVSLKLIEIANEGNIFVADAVLTESYNKSVNVTSYPVESDTDVSVSARVRDFTVNVSGVTSDASMSYFNVLEDIRSSAVGRIFSTSTKSQRAYETLNKWCDQGTPLQLNCKYAKEGFREQTAVSSIEANETTKGGAIIPFVIQNLTITRDKDTGAALRYSMTLRRIKQVKIGRQDLVTNNPNVQTQDRGSQQLQSNSKSAAAGEQKGAEAIADDSCSDAAANLFKRGGLTSLANTDCA